MSLTYAISYCEQGNGHKNRQEVLARQLRSEGHKVLIVNDEIDIFDWRANYKDGKLERRTTIPRNLAGLVNGFFPSVKNCYNFLKDEEVDVCVVDLQPAFAVAARIAGLPLISFDHQHAITNLEIDLPGTPLLELAARALIPTVYANHYVVTNFFPTTPLTKRRLVDGKTLDEITTVIGPILREEILQAKTSDEGHVLVYLTDPSSTNSIQRIAKETDRTIYVYNSDKERGTIDNIVFSDEKFETRLASAHAVVVNGGNNVIGESLYHGTPVFCLPIKGAFEQQVNALNVLRRGYGLMPTTEPIDISFRDFLDRIPEFRRQIERDKWFFNGNDMLMPVFKEICTDRLMPTNLLRKDLAKQSEFDNSLGKKYAPTENRTRV